MVNYWQVLLLCRVSATVLKPAPAVVKPPSSKGTHQCDATLQLLRAAQRGDVDTVQGLLRHGLGPDALSQSGFTALVVAASNGHVTTVEALLEGGAAIDHSGGAIAALHAAAGKGHVKVVEVLCERGASVDALSRSSGFTPLMYAAQAGHAACVAELLRAGSCAKAIGRTGYTALHAAAFNGRAGTAMVLVDAGATVDARGNEGFTPLHIAAAHGHGAFVDLLLARGAAVDARSKEGHTPLHALCGRPLSSAELDSSETDVAIARQLIRHGAHPNARSHFGQTPLHKAAASGSLSLTQLLLSNGGSVDAVAQSGDSPLHSALHSSHVGRDAVFELLLAAAGDLEASKPAVWASVLDEAAWRGSTEAVQWLLSQRPRAPDSVQSAVLPDAAAAALSGALAIAIERGHEDAAHFLRSGGAIAPQGQFALNGVIADGVADAADGADGADRSSTLSDTLPDPPAQTSDSAVGTMPAEWAETLLSMPPLARQLLVQGTPPEHISASALLQETCARAPYSTYRASKAAIAGGEAGTVLCATSQLDQKACAALRAALDTDGITTIDSVDRMREHVLYLDKDQVEHLIGKAAMRRLEALPQRFQHAAAAAAGTANAATDNPYLCRDPPAASNPREYFLFDCFLRRYSADTSGCNQLLTSFHADTAALTLNVALTSDACVEGGRLLGAYQGAVRLIERETGDVTVHSSALLHGVTRMHAGTRYSMIMFFACAST